MIDISQRKKRTSSTVGLAMNAYAYGKVFIVVSDNYYTSVIRALFSVYFEFKKKKIKDKDNSFQVGVGCQIGCRLSNERHSWPEFSCQKISTP